MTNGAPAPNQTTGISSSPTGSISWTDITPDPTKASWPALAINAGIGVGNALMAASDGKGFWTSDDFGDGWLQWDGVGTASVAISTAGVIGSGPGINFAGIPTNWGANPATGNPGTNYQAITAAGAAYSVPTSYTDLSGLITQQAAIHGLDPDTFARQLFKESGFNPDPPHNSAARGIAQLEPVVYRDTYHIDPLNPNAAVPVAANIVASNKGTFTAISGLRSPLMIGGRARSKAGWRQGRRRTIRSPTFRGRRRRTTSRSSPAGRSTNGWRRVLG